VPVEKLVFLDECGFSLNLHRRYGWARKGQRCVEAVPFDKGANRSVVGAFSLPSEANPSGLWALWQNKKAWTALTFQLFVEEAVLSQVPAGSVLVLDNARIHGRDTLRERVEKAGCSLLFLPPYSPDLNPIEMVWSWIKNCVRGLAPRTDEQREKDIHTAQHALPPEHASKWFAHCGLT
jgi:transposase